MTDVLLIILIIAVLVLILINLFKKNPSQDGKMLEVTQNSLKVLGESISQNQKNAQQNAINHKSKKRMFFHKLH